MHSRSAQSAFAICLLPLASHKEKALSCQENSRRNGTSSTPTYLNTFLNSINPFSAATVTAFPKPLTLDATTTEQHVDSFLPIRVSEAVLEKAKELASKRFQPGNYWVWLHRDPSGQPYSWERYSVSETGNDAEIVIEMSSRFSKDEKYAVHHRMKLSLAECLASRVYHKGWRFREWCYKHGGEWCLAPFLDNVQAFEEKFDLFLMGDDVPTDRIQNMRLQSVAGLDTFGPTGLVQTKRHSYTGAWYARDPRQQPGLAAFKEFVEDYKDSGSPYTFELVEVGNEQVPYSE